MADHASGRASTYRFQAFISYSHRADSRFAAILHSAIEQLAKPWYRRRALNVFRDDTDLAINPQLWPTIEKALNDSENLLLFACPEAAASDGVRREISHWIHVLKRDCDKVLIAVTGGTLVWEEHAQDFDWSKTTALPMDFKGYFRGHPEPLWADFSGSKANAMVRLDDATFRGPAVKLAAALHGVPPRDLESEDLRQHRKTIQMFGAFIAGLVVLLVATLLLFVDARRQRKEAERRARVAESRALAVQAMDRSDKRLDVALLLAVEALRTDNTLESRKALLGALLASPYVGKFLDGANSAEALAFHPNRSTLASASATSILVWDTDSNVPPRHIGDDRYKALAFVQSGSILCAVTENGKIILWNFETGEPIATLAGGSPESVHLAAINENRSSLAIVTDSEIRLWDLEHRVISSTIPVDQTDPILSVALSPVENVVALASGGSGIRLWDGTKKQFRSTTFEGHAGEVTALAFAPDGAVLASGGEDNSVRLWTAATGSQGRQWLRQGWVTRIQFSPDGRYLAWGTYQGRIGVFDSKEDHALETSELEIENGIGALAFGSDSQRLAVASQTGGGVLELDLSHKSKIVTVARAHHNWIIGIAFSPDGTLAASASRDGELILWDAKRKSIVSRSKVGDEIGMCMEFSPDGKTLITCSPGKAIVWRIENKKAAPVGGVVANTGEIRSVKFRPDGRVLAAGGSSGEVMLWDVAGLTTTRPTILTALGRDISTLEFNPNGDLIAVGCGDGNIYLVDLTGHKTGLSGGRNSISDLKFSPDGSVLYSGGALGVTSWNVKLHKTVGTPFVLRQSEASSVAISHDGRVVASAARSGLIALWDTEQRVLLGELPSHGSSFFSVAMAPNGALLAAGSGYDIPEDNAVMFWDLDPEVWIQDACAMAGRNLTREERLRYIGDASPAETCQPGRQRY